MTGIYHRTSSETGWRRLGILDIPCFINSAFACFVSMIPHTKITQFVQIYYKCLTKSSGNIRKCY